MNGRIRAIYNNAAHELIPLCYEALPVVDEQMYTIGLIGYHILISAAFLNITNEELLSHEPSKVIATSVPEVLEEYLKNHQNIGRKVEGTLTYQ